MRRGRRGARAVILSKCCILIVLRFAYMIYTIMEQILLRIQCLPCEFYCQNFFFLSFFFFSINLVPVASLNNLSFHIICKVIDVSLFPFIIRGQKLAKDEKLVLYINQWI
jgi:hypothetical protein